jgi:hypothetical protein
MSESKVREQAAIDARAKLKAANTRQASHQPAEPKVIDAFGRRIALGDGILVGETTPMNTIWRVQQFTHATEPQFAGGVWVDVVSISRVLVQANVPNGTVVLALLAPEQAQDTPAGTPAAGATPSGIILSDPDRLSER